MHEMSITQALLDMVLDKIPPQMRVTDIYLRVGEMSCVEPDTVAIYFAHLSREGPAAEAQLHFQAAPLHLTCRDCGRQWQFERENKTERSPQILRRAFAAGCRCRSKNLKMSGGMGCELERFEVEPADFPKL